MFDIELELDVACDELVKVEELTTTLQPDKEISRGNVKTNFFIHNIFLNLRL